MVHYLFDSHFVVCIKLFLVSYHFRSDLSLMSRPSKDDTDGESYSQYQDWLQERKLFRHDLENMGLNEKWLTSKPSKTALEKRVLARMIDARTPRPCVTPVSDCVLFD